MQVTGDVIFRKCWGYPEVPEEDIYLSLHY
jgi:hypothetical protein